MALTTHKRKKFNQFFWGFFFSGITIVVLSFLFISIGWIGYVPNLEDLQNPINKSATEIYSSDMQLLGRYFSSNDNRISLSYNEIDKDIVNALIATEDERFHKHSGVDIKAVGRAIVSLLTQSNKGGGSTITQQLAKQLYSETATNKFARLLQKPVEWVIAVKLERLYSKEEIIALYLNKFDFLYNAVGIKSAAKTYFNKTADNLKIEEAALLIGMCKNPTLYNPVRYKKRAKNRRNVVLAQMRKSNIITSQELDSLKKTPLILDFKRMTYKDGLAPYFRQYLKKILNARKPKKRNYANWQQQEYKDDKWAWENNPLYGFFSKNKKSNGEKYNLYTDGLKIYTTIDSKMQKYAEEAVLDEMSKLQKAFFRENKYNRKAPFSNNYTQKEVNKMLKRAMRQTERYRKMRKSGATEKEIEKAFNKKVEMEVFSYKGWKEVVMTPIDSIKYYKHFLRCGLMSIDPRNGYVKAYVGGSDFRAFRYDMVTLGRRQVGSTIKPYLYSLAMQEGLTPCDKILNDSITYGDWTPKNDSQKRVGEYVPLVWGLQTSNNWISARLMGQFTPDALVTLMRSFGIKGHIDPTMSLALGTAEVSVAEMVDAYTTFPNKGIRTEAMYVTRIEDSNGNIIAEFTPKMHEILSESAANKMIYMLQNVINNGTGGRVRYKYQLHMPTGGKTGTSQNNADGWFMGFTPKLVTGVWVGGEEPSIHFKETRQGQGAATALPIWAVYMKKVLEDKTLEYKPTDRFDLPLEYSIEATCE
ncbi:MAG: penicillin-binding protein [Paludibacter sp.]|nr:MAG: penicillin-binding protein [Paludibacter sp.]